MKQGNLLEYVKVMVRNRLNMMFGVRLEENQAPPKFDSMIEDLPVYIRRAVIELQNTGIIPKQELSFLSLERKREVLAPDATVRYNYYDLPDDFRELDDFVVEGLAVQPKYVDSEYQMPAKALIENRTLFTVINVTSETSGLTEHRLIVYPFPSDDKTVYIKYAVDGTESDAPSVIEKYWDAVLHIVYRDLGIMSSAEANDFLTDKANAERHPQGSSTGLGTRPRVKASFFGNTSNTLNRRRL